VALRERYPLVLAEHRRLVCAAIADRSSREVDTQATGSSQRSAARCRRCGARWTSSGPW
jgi:hypothetical protein